MTFVVVSIALGASGACTFNGLTGNAASFTVGSTIHFTWSPPSGSTCPGGFLGYGFYVQTPGTSTFSAVSPNPSGTSYNYTPTAAGAYAFYVSAFYGGPSCVEMCGGNGMPSNTVAVLVQAPCSYSIAPESASLPASGGSGSLVVSTPNGCTWGAVSNSGFITITGGSAGSGNGVISFSVAPNSGAARSGTLTAAGKTFTVNQAAVNGLVGGCTESPVAMCLNQSRFRVEARYTTSGGQSGAGQAVRLTSDTGYFWFFGSTNVEVVIKVIDGCVLSHTYWVFAAGLTDVGVDITVTDTLRNVTQHYANPVGTPFQPVQDTSAFSTCQ